MYIFNPHQFNMLRTQIHSYKLIIRNEQVPQKILDVLKSKPPVAPGTTITAAMNGQPQQQPMQMNAQQIRMRNELNTIFFLITVRFGLLLFYLFLTHFSFMVMNNQN